MHEQIAGVPMQSPEVGIVPPEPPVLQKWRVLSAGEATPEDHAAIFESIRDEAAATFENDDERDAFHRGADVVRWLLLAEPTVPAGMVRVTENRIHEDSIKPATPVVKWGVLNASTKLREHGLDELVAQRAANLKNHENNKVLYGTVLEAVKEHPAARYLQSFSPIEAVGPPEETPLSPRSRQAAYNNYLSDIYQRHNVQNYTKTSPPELLADVRRIDMRLDMLTEPQQGKTGETQQQIPPQQRLARALAKLWLPTNAGEFSGFKYTEKDMEDVPSISFINTNGGRTVFYEPQVKDLVDVLAEKTGLYTQSSDTYNIFAEQLQERLPYLMGLRKRDPQHGKRAPSQEEAFDREVRALLNCVADDFTDLLEASPYTSRSGDISPALTCLQPLPNIPEVAGYQWKLRFDPPVLDERAHITSREQDEQDGQQIVAEIVAGPQKSSLLYYDRDAPLVSKLAWLSPSNITAKDVLIRANFDERAPLLEGHRLRGFSRVHDTFVYEAVPDAGEAVKQQLPIDGAALADVFRAEGHEALAHKFTQQPNASLAFLEDTLRAHSRYFMPKQSTLEQIMGDESYGIIVEPDMFYLQCGGAAELLTYYAGVGGYALETVRGHVVHPGQTAITGKNAHAQPRMQTVAGELWFNSTPSIIAAEQASKGSGSLRRLGGTVLALFGKKMEDNDVLAAALQETATPSERPPVRTIYEAQTRAFSEITATKPDAAPLADTKQDKITAQSEYEAIARQIGTRYNLAEGWDLNTLAKVEPNALNTDTMDILLRTYQLGYRTAGALSGTMDMPTAEEFSSNLQMLESIATSTPDALHSLGSPVYDQQLLQGLQIAVQKFAKAAQAVN